ncbi:alpha/beta hydrolase [Humisphaera borealis]|uniref:Alpha/beta hydrolase n=1 Tax=Humisphaera borealis TaxID=2807512 RepID=A0A7M2X0X2_9BACT|nr:alpha/beta hydrolase [Humisphaera borealis]QOV91388.1 alpha/beta hydrolase [Humisphaera borealis]
MRRRFSFVATTLVLLGAATVAHAQATRPALKVPAGVKYELDIPYVANGDVSQKLDLYLPEKPSDKPLPLLVWIHGGGWRGGTKAGCPGLNMVPQGYAAASIEYRFSQKALFPAQIQDCQAAIRFLRANAKKYNLDTERFAVWGASAGGHLAALVGTSGGKKAFPPIGGNEEQSDRVQAVCDIFGPANFNTVMEQAAADKAVKNIFAFNTPSDPYSGLIGGTLGKDTAKCDAVSPITYVGKDTPPILILHGTADTLVPYAQSVEFADALKKAGVEVILQPFPGAGHGGPAFNLPAVQVMTNKFFDKYLKGIDAKIEPLPASAVTVPTAKPAERK